MENQHKHPDPNQIKQITEELLEKSAELKTKNAQVVEKLEELRKQTENLLNSNNDKNPNNQSL